MPDRQLADRGLLRRAHAGHDEAVEGPAVRGQQSHRHVASADDLRRQIGHPLQHRLEAELRHEAGYLSDHPLDPVLRRSPGFAMGGFYPPDAAWRGR